MFLSTTQDVWYSVASVCLAVITVFLCWALYTLIKVLRQADEVISETREKVGQVEEAVSSIVERVTTALSYMNILTEGGKQLLSYFGNRSEKKRLSTSKRKSKDEDEE